MYFIVLGEGILLKPFKVGAISAITEDSFFSRGKGRFDAPDSHR